MNKTSEKNPYSRSSISGGVKANIALMEVNILVNFPGSVAHHGSHLGDKKSVKEEIECHLNHWYDFAEIPFKDL